MRRVMLLALLALALPTALLARSVDYSTGKFERGTIIGTFSTSIDATEVGSLNTITIDTGTLTKLSNCAKGFTCYDFSGGSVTVTHDGTTLFTDSLKGGTVKEGVDSADITATLLSSATISQGTADATLEWRDPHARDRHEHGRSEEGHTQRDRHERDRRGRFELHRKLDTGSSNVSLATTTVPEPATLGLLGTGLIGLAGLARRRLTRGT